MKKFEFKTLVTLEIPSIVVAENEEAARERLTEVLDHAQSAVTAIYIKETIATTSLQSVEKVPDHFSPSHRILLEMGYPFDTVAKYSAEDADAEIDASMTLM